MATTLIPRPEYPRPELERDVWMNLNGTWEFEIDGGRSGRERGLARAERLSGTITVPFCPESELSGVHNRDFMPAVWYRRTAPIPAEWLADGRRVLLHIGACDYETEVFVNGESVGRHRGGYVAFSFDITEKLRAGENVLTVVAEDDVRSGLQPGGKQSSRYASHGCDYTRTTGIWQTVWLENVAAGYIRALKLTPDAENACLHVEARTVGLDGERLAVRAACMGNDCGEGACTVSSGWARLTLPLTEKHLWSCDSPILYDLTLSCGADRVKSYFGLRSLKYENGLMYLNGKPVFQRLVLDQGFYPDGVYTAPSDEALAADITRSMAMGFNGARLHQKVFEPRFLYHCDRLGYLVWGEHANWQMNAARPEAWRGFLPEWLEILQRDYNHPAIIGWCPLNETQKDVDPLFVAMLRDLTHDFDATRPFIDGSGWQHVPGCTDITDLHSYTQSPEKFAEELAPLAAGEPIKAYFNQGGFRPTFVSEYGGVWWSETDESGWGYGERVKSREEYIARVTALTRVLMEHPAICGLCYTQLTDVEQEQNGLYTFDRKPKFDPELLHEVLSAPAVCEQS